MFAGVLMIIAGVFGLLQGIAVIAGQAWARWLGLIFVSVQAVTNFLYIPVQPWWAITLILVDLWVIHALFVYRPVRV